MAINFLSDQTVDGTLTVSSITEIGSDTDKFLMSDGGKITYVTGATLLTYIGAPTTDYYVTSTSFDTATGVLSLFRSGIGTLTQDIDGRYLQLIAAAQTITGSIGLAGNLGVTGYLQADEFRDTGGDSGTAGQLLSSTGTGTDWITGGVIGVVAGDGLTGGGVGGTVTVDVDYLGTGNIILEANAAVTPVGADTIIINDANDNNVKQALISNLPFSTTPSDVGLSSISNNGNTITGSLTLSSTLYVPYQIAHVGDTTTRMQFSTGQWTVYTSNAARLQCNSTYTRVNGNFVATGNITAYFSDERLKTKTGNIENALDKINSLEGFIYVENDLAKSLGFDNNKQQVGLSAQSVKAVLPEAVTLAPVDYLEDELNNDGEHISKSGEDYLTVDYSKLVPLLIEAVKELTSEVADLKRKLK